MPKQPATETQSFYVRLKPRDEKHGHRLRTFAVYGQTFEEELGWYVVPEYVRTLDNKSGQKKAVNLIEYLREVRQSEDQDSPLAFDVCTKAEAAAIDRAEETARNKRVKAIEIGGRKKVNDLTSRKVRGDEDADNDDSEEEIEEVVPQKTRRRKA